VLTRHLSDLRPVLPVTSEARRLRRLVIKDLLNLLHNVRCQLGNNRNGAHVVLNLLNLGGTEDDGADVGVLGAPRQAELGGVAAETLGDLGQAADLFDLSLALGGLELLDLGVEEVAVVGEAGTFGDAVVVLSGQESGGERGPDGCTILVLVEKRLVLDLETLTVESVVLRLLGNGGNEVVLLGDLSGLGSEMLSADD